MVSLASWVSLPTPVGALTALSHVLISLASRSMRHQVRASLFGIGAAPPSASVGPQTSEMEMHLVAQHRDERWPQIEPHRRRAAGLRGGPAAATTGIPRRPGAIEPPEDHSHMSIR